MANNSSRVIPSYEVDANGNAYTVLEAHKWKRVKAWMTAADGSRQQSDQQERNDEGKGLWSRYAYINRLQYGNPVPEMVELRMWSFDNPNQANCLDSDDIFGDGENV